MLVLTFFLISLSSENADEKPSESQGTYKDDQNIYAFDNARLMQYIYIYRV